MKGSNIVVETVSQKAVCVMAVSSIEKRVYLAWMYGESSETSCNIHTTWLEMHDSFPYEKWFELLFRTILKGTEIYFHVTGKIDGSWIDYIHRNYNWVQASCDLAGESHLSLNDIDGPAVPVLMHLLEVDLTTVNRIYEPIQGILSVDSDALNDLGIITRKPEAPSILDMVLSQCMTTQGRKCMKDWFMFPLASNTVRSSRLDMIEALVLNRHIISAARKILKRIGNPWALVETLWKNQTLPKPAEQTKNFIKLRDALGSLMELQDISLQDEGSMFLLCLSQATAATVQRTRCLIEKIIDPEQLPEGMCIHYGVSQQLDSLKSMYFGLNNMMEKLVMLERDRVPKSFRRSGDIFTWEMIHVHQVGVFIHCPTGILPLYLEEYLSDWNLVFEPGALQDHQGALYSTDSCMQLHERFGSVFPTILDLEAAMSTNLTNKILAEKDTLQKAFQVVASLDCMLALAKFSLDQNLSRPQYSATGPLKIKDGWNPILQCTELSSKCIPNDTIIHGGQRSHIIIGKGGTGKSTYLQQVSIILFLAHIGCFVPAKQASIPLNIDRIFCMISSQESLHDSSFSHGLRQILEMLQHGGSTSIFLVESFGKATVSSDGIALAASIIKHLSGKGGILIFATHMGQLLLDQLDSLESICQFYSFASIPASFSMGKQTPLFRLIAGKDTKEKEIDCTIMCEACPTIVERARHILDLISEKSSQNPLRRHPEFSVLPYLSIIESVKKIRSKADAIKFIKDESTPQP